MLGSLQTQPLVAFQSAQRQQVVRPVQLRSCRQQGARGSAAASISCMRGAPVCPQRPCRGRPLSRAAAAAQADSSSAAQETAQPETWYALVANANFMFNDVQNEALAEQLREKKRFYGEQKKDLDFFVVSEPAWLDEKFSSQAKRVGRPCAALVSTDQQWITFMKLRLDRVLKLELTGLTRQEVFKSLGPVPEFTPPEKWTAPYSPYRKGWWEAFMPDKLGLVE
mmetsp:Transcript_15605/g.47086  ORF Transcript_15605/g.47086 Transcript_15605/m.47086 type:complete len:224 (+) Transcript_15605:211-882(+)